MDFSCALKLSDNTNGILVGVLMRENENIDEALSRLELGVMFEVHGKERQETVVACLVGPVEIGGDSIILENYPNLRKIKESSNFHIILQ